MKLWCAGSAWLASVSIGRSVNTGQLGVAPIVRAQIWEDFRTSDIPEARIDTAKAKGNVSIEKLLWAFHFLMRYPTETQTKALTGNYKKTATKWQKYFLSRIRALKAAR